MLDSRRSGTGRPQQASLSDWPLRGTLVPAARLIHEPLTGSCCLGRRREPSPGDLGPLSGQRILRRARLEIPPVGVPVDALESRHHRPPRLLFEHRMFSRVFSRRRDGIYSHTLSWAFGAFGGIRTPNLLIRRPISGVRKGIRRLPLIASELGRCGRAVSAGTRRVSGDPIHFRYIDHSRLMLGLDARRPWSQVWIKGLILGNALIDRFRRFRPRNS